jgi:hypothetical protein
MQTFLPYPDFRMSAQTLDRQRLGKQRVEGLQLINSLVGITNGKGWTNHPARNMWRGHERALVEYTSVVCQVWRERGYKDTVEEKVRNLETQYLSDLDTNLPNWLGNEDFHRSHRSNLLRKDHAHYRQFWPDEPADLPYVWPVLEEKP